MNEIQAAAICSQCYAALDPRSPYCPVCGFAATASRQALIVPGQSGAGAPYAAPTAYAPAPWPQQAPPPPIPQALYGAATPVYYPAATAAPAWSPAAPPMAYAPPIVMAAPPAPAAAPVIIMNGDRSAPPAPSPVVIVSNTTHDGLATLGSALVVWGAALTVSAICILILVLIAASH